MGYFGFGWARRCRVGLGGLKEGVVVVTRDDRGRLLCVVTASTISLWSAGRHRVVLGSKRWRDLEGEFIGGCFEESGRLLMAVTTVGEVLTLKLRAVNEDESLIDFNVPEADADTLDSGEESLPQVKIMESGRVKLGMDAATICTGRSGTFIGSSSGDIAMISWDLTVKYRINLQEHLLQNNYLRQLGAFEHQGDAEEALRAGKGINALDFCRNRSLLAVVTKSGVALLLIVAKDEPPDPRNGWWLRSTKAASVALEPTRGTVAVGLENGDIELYLVSYSPGERCQLLRRLSLSSWYFVPEEVGAAQQLRWSDDGSALATGWEKQGLVIWSLSGCRLVWTLPQVGSAVASTPVSSARGGRGTDPLGSGVKSLAWGPQGYSLWGIPRRFDSHEIVEYQLFKSGVLNNPCQSEATRLAMIGSDRILVLGLKDETGMELFDWQQLLYQRDYMQSNWPPRLVAVNAELNYLAIAGRRGFAICNIRTRRWRVFGDIRQEQSIKCCALAWVGKFVCACCEKKSSSFELRLYPRDHLDESSMVALKELPGKVECIDVRADGYVLLLCAKGSLVILKVEEDGGKGKVKLTPTLEVVLQDSLAEEISAVRIYPPLAMNAKGLQHLPKPTEVILVKRSGSLLLLDLVRTMSLPLSRNVEHFWYTSSTEVPFESTKQRPLWWAHGSEGLFVSFADINSKSETSTERWFDWDPEVYPLGLTPVHGMVLGITQGLVFNDLPKEGTLSKPCHIISVKRQPVLHRVLRHMLMSSNDDRAALQLALRCVNLPQFGDSLEWLLYETVLEQDRHDVEGSAADTSTREGLFRRVVWLLRYFGEYEDIVVRCARKMDSHWWPLLFAYAGEPASLLESCSHTGRLRTAACLLVILQEMFGYMSSTPHALRLLNASLETGQLELAAELANFLRKAHQANMLNSVQMQIRQEISRTVDDLVAQDGTEPSTRPLLIVVASVISRATILLDEMNLRALGAMARAMNFPLHIWLAKTRAGKPLVSDLQKNLFLLHEQFNWPPPLVESVDSKVDALHRVRSGQVDIINGSVHNGRPASRRGYNPTVCGEVIYLQKVCLKATSYDLAVLLSALLLDLEALLAILTSNPALSEPTLSGLSRLPSPGYQHLAHELKHIMAEK